MSINTTKATDLVDQYYNQVFLLDMIKQASTDDEDSTVFNFLEKFKVKEFYDADGNLKSVEDAIFNNPDFKDVFEEKPLEAIPEGEP